MESKLLVVCLDQCAISKLAISRAKDGAIDELKTVMMDASEKGKLICPVASETIVETTALRNELRIQIHELHSHLAGGRTGNPLWEFKNMWRMINEETLALARSEPPPSAFDRFRWVRIEDDQLASEKATGFKMGKQRMIARVQSHEFTPIPGLISPKATTPRIILEHAGHVLRQIKRALADKELNPDDHMGYELVQYLQKQNITKAQLEKLVQDILYHRWEAIPVIFCRTQLAGQLSADFQRPGNPRKYMVNDEFDIPRLAVGLSSADMIITDAGMAQLCHTVKTQQWTQTKVFAVRETTKILSHLEAALS